MASLKTQIKEATEHRKTIQPDTIEWVEQTAIIDQLLEQYYETIGESNEALSANHPS